jgi:hypothetical protein
MISNGPRDHTRAMPRPVPNIVRACVRVTFRTELVTFGRPTVTLSYFASGQHLAAMCPGLPRLAFVDQTRL